MLRESGVLEVTTKSTSQEQTLHAGIDCLWNSSLWMLQRCLADTLDAWEHLHKQLMLIQPWAKAATGGRGRTMQTLSPPFILPQGSRMQQWSCYNSMGLCALSQNKTEDKRNRFVNCVEANRMLSGSAKESICPIPQRSARTPPSRELVTFQNLHPQKQQQHPSVNFDECLWYTHYVCTYVYTYIYINTVFILIYIYTFLWYIYDNHIHVYVYAIIYIYILYHQSYAIQHLVFPCCRLRTAIRTGAPRI